jgi:uncharacterized membrane protein YkvA (DUF1232 family)
MTGRLRGIAVSLHRELRVYRGVMRDPRVPLAARIVLGAAVAYALSPIDLVPDWLPVVGHLDDLLIVPLLVFVALRLIPRHVVAEHRRRRQDGSLHGPSPAGPAGLPCGISDAAPWSRNGSDRRLHRGVAARGERG